MNANDPTGSGANTRETYLNVTNVTVSRFGKLFSLPVDGDVYAQPLYWGGLKLKGASNVVFVATSNDSVYAFDADKVVDGDAGSASPLWKVSVGTPERMPSSYVGNDTSSPLNCASSLVFINELGVTSTPYLDVATSTLYVLALDVDSSALVSNWTCIHNDPSQSNYCESYTCSAPTFRYKLHALDARTGAEKLGGPITVEGKVTGSGAESVNGVLAFDTMRAFPRAGLLEAYGNVYVAFSGYSDIPPYHGWVFAYDAKTLAKVGQFCDSPEGEQAGIWQSGRSLLSNGRDDSVYVVTGNGTFNVHTGGRDYGDSVLRLASDLSKVDDYFSPFLSDYDDTNFLSVWDDDLGSAGAAMIPGTTLLLASGKLGNGYLLDTADLGKNAPTGDRVVQKVRMTWQTDKHGCADGVNEALIFGTPVVWTGLDGTHVYVWAMNDYLRDYLLDGSGRFRSEGVCFCTVWPVVGPDSEEVDVEVSDPPCGVPNGESQSAALYGGAALSVSSNGKEKGTGIVWATRSVRGNANGRSSPGVLEAYDATDVSTTQPIWSSATKPARDGLGNWAKFAPPTVANGKVYVPTFSDQVVVYGLLGESP
jgi:hypothetical protein